MESEVEMDLNDTDESDEDSDEDVCQEVDKENQPPMDCPADNYVAIEPKTNKHTMARDRYRHPLLDLNLCRRFNAGTKPTEPTLKLRGLTLLVPTTSTWEHKFPIKSHRWYMYIFWHTIILAVVNAWLLYKRDCKALKMSSKETMNRRQFQAQLASSLILVNATLQTPKRGRPSSGKGSPATQSDIRKPSECSKEAIQEMCTPPIGCTQGPSCPFPKEDRERTLQTLQ
ncbi:hypothetical protein N1851_000579 [Merluccius polli]|uniref:PiggyBac transposable element-derived protein domain-containing protein n=1 Tax=Merluccius polli TaxID=89951 RepID=A0AA47NDD3_MERPO|nr:hypothetical protein N1851_000579 [Merluccius polli]